MEQAVCIPLTVCLNTDPDWGMGPDCTLGQGQLPGSVACRVGQLSHLAFLQRVCQHRLQKLQQQRYPGEPVRALTCPVWGLKCVTLICCYGNADALLKCALFLVFLLTRCKNQSVMMSYFKSFKLVALLQSPLSLALKSTDVIGVTKHAMKTRHGHIVVPPA